MAERIRASAHPLATPAQRLAVDVADRLGDIRTFIAPYVCIEPFIRPMHLREHDEFTATPAELGALVAAVNTEFEGLLQAVDDAGEALSKALRKAARKTLKAKPNKRQKALRRTA
ncbi:hypothetical protein [Variovorax sp. YR216]|uniref:hypothetical protein n=1 Tax=Variovorax sp. YR216 TaxID=1882828 RepID=UPI000897DE6D|nr:hypothetical protein [Variovorax sp. YR216]SEB12163.1 hypothetical protein SAMN05444680_108126 [Variovorax sp. YR216]